MPRLAVILAVVVVLCALAPPEAAAKKKKCRAGMVWDPYLGECVSRRGSYF